MGGARRLVKPQAEERKVWGALVLGPPLSGGGMVGFGEGGFSESRKSAGLWWNEEARGNSMGGAANRFLRKSVARPRLEL